MSRAGYLTQKQLNTLRGKALAGHLTTAEMLSVFAHADEFEFQLDQIEGEHGDFFGTEGWRRLLGVPEDGDPMTNPPEDVRADGQPRCGHCGGLHYGTPSGVCVYVCRECGGDMRIDIATCKCERKVMPTATETATDGTGIAVTTAGLDSPPVEERILQVAILGVDRATIYTMPRPARHGNIMQALWDMGHRKIGPSAQGFITTAGRFVGREEAFQIAHKAGQILRANAESGHLMTEDLWPRS